MKWNEMAIGCVEFEPPRACTTSSSVAEQLLPVIVILAAVALNELQGVTDCIPYD